MLINLCIKIISNCVIRMVIGIERFRLKILKHNHKKQTSFDQKNPFFHFFFKFQYNKTKCWHTQRLTTFPLNIISDKASHNGVCMEKRLQLEIPLLSTYFFLKIYINILKNYHIIIIITISAYINLSNINTFYLWWCKN